MSLRDAALLFTLLGAGTQTVMSGTALSPALPAIAEHFAGVPDGRYLVQLALTMPALFIVIGSPVTGYLVDRLGAKPILVVSTVLYVIVGTTGLYMDDLHAILAGRALLGLTISGIMTATMALIGAVYEGPRRSAVLGYQTASMALGGVIYLIGGGFLAGLGWRMPFLLYALPTVLLPTLIALVPAGRAPGADVKPVAGEVPWLRFALAYVCGFAVMVAFYLIPVQLAFHLAEAGEPSPAKAGLAISATSLVTFIVSLMYHRLVTRIGMRTALSLTFLLVGAGLMVAAKGDSYVIVILGMALTGAGNGLMFPALVGLILADAPPSIRGRATGGLTMAVFLGQFTSPIIINALNPTGSTTVAFLGTGAVTAAVGVALLAFLRMRRGMGRA